MELSMGMTSRVEVEEDSDNNKGSMWDLDQKLDQPMDEEAGRLRNMYREKVLEHYNFPSLSHPLNCKKQTNKWNSVVLGEVRQHTLLADAIFPSWDELI